MIFAVSCSEEGDTIINNYISEPAYDCEYLIIGYFDGDNNLSHDMIRDMFSMSSGLNTSDASKAKILILFDGLDYEICENPTLKQQVDATRLIELKSLEENVINVVDQDPDTKMYNFEKADSKFNFDNITGKDFTKECGFIPFDATLNRYEVDMSNPDTLKNFLDFAAKKYKPKHTLLTINDHGLGPVSSTGSVKGKSSSRAVCIDETSNRDFTIAIGTDQLAKAISSSLMKKVDILHFDACLEASLENIYECKDCAGYIVASPNSSTGVPWSYIIEGYISDSVSTATVAMQIAIEAAYEKKVTADTDNAKSKMPYTNDYVTYSPTYSVFSTAHINSLKENLSELIDMILDSIPYSDFYKDCKDKESGMIMEFLNTYMKEHPNYVPMPVDYLVSRDYSFLLSRNPHGWIGVAPDDYSSKSSLINKNDAGDFISGKTTMAYRGTYNQLIDIGYLMDMFLCNSYTWVTKNIQLVEDTDTKAGYTLKDFSNKCFLINKILSDVILISHRNDCTVGKTITSTNLNSTADIDPFNFYLTRILSDTAFTDTIDIVNHYGLTISSSSSNTYYDSAITFKRIGERPALPDEYYMVYRDCCAFVKETRWIELLDKIFVPEAVEWEFSDWISDL